MRRQEVRSEMRREVRAQELSEMSAGRRSNGRLSNDPGAGPRLLAVYGALAERGEHLLGGLLGGALPKQWSHYPEDDAIDAGRGYQWFYHSHSPEDRPGAIEHGHIHLFARRPLWGRRLQSRSEKAFARLCGQPASDAHTRHLLAIGFDAKGLPISLFTVNSWVTGDLMLGSDLTVELLASMQLETGHPEIDAVIESTVRMCLPEIAHLVSARDEALVLHAGPDKLNARSLELLSELAVDLDAKLRIAVCSRKTMVHAGFRGMRS
ncbi:MULTISPECIES: DUF6969 family protein [Acidovorax]|uniref:DUF6969 domain-containing protein n=3 Tax=Acidovorax soli TaxID=592050 RepID=A0A1H4BWW3_9BURK|nr:MULTISPECIES: hypothetical protein [Acidovorax]SEA52671.1 hypothetical protein SAMN05421875_11632 [Acidovorax soli]